MKIALPFCFVATVLFSTASAQTTFWNRSRIEALLDRPAPAMDLVEGIALQDFARLIADELERSAGVVIPVVLDQTELELESIDPEREILSPVFVEDGTHSVAQVMGLALGDQDPGLNFIPMDGHVLITTEAKMFEVLYTRIYDIRDVLSQYSPKPQKGGRRTASPAAAILNSIVTMTSGNGLRWMNYDGEGGTVALLRGHLILNQTHHGHRVVQQLLKEFLEPTRVASETNPVPDSATPEVKIQSAAGLPLFCSISGWVVALLLASVLVMSQRPANHSRTQPGMPKQATGVHEVQTHQFTEPAVSG